MGLNILRKDFWKSQRLVLLAFLVVHTAASFYYISQHNITYDEPQYFEYAKRWLHGKPERLEPLDDSKSPIIAVSWTPRIVRQAINPNYQLNDYGRKDQQEGRYMMIVFSFITALYVYWWCKELYGDKGWWLPLLLLLFDPLYLAYSTLITTDLACGTFLVAILYHFRKFLVFQFRKHFYLAALFTALGIVTKQSLLFVILLLPLLSITYIIVSPKRLLPKKAFVDLILFSITVLLVINCMYYFHKSFFPFGEYVFESRILQNFQRTFTFLHSLPVPLPYSFVQSVDMIKAHADLGAAVPERTYNGVYLFGELKLDGGYWYYYLVLLWYKTPIGIMVLFLATIVLFIKNFKLEGFIKRYMFLIVPTVFYAFILSFVNQFQTGVRHILLIFPLLYIGSGYLFKEVARAGAAYKTSAGTLVIYSLISISIYYPYIIPYTNEFISKKETVYKKISDSSIDYGQSDSSVNTFIAFNPQYKKASPVPDTGKFAVIQRQMLNDYLREDNIYKWYQKFEPKGHYRYTILLYDIKEDDLVKAGMEIKK